jgi:hypothetical protein
MAKPAGFISRNPQKLERKKSAKNLQVILDAVVIETNFKKIKINLWAGLMDPKGQADPISKVLLTAKL